MKSEVVMLGCRWSRNDKNHIEHLTNNIEIDRLTVKKYARYRRRAYTNFYRTRNRRVKGGVKN